MKKLFAFIIVVFLALPFFAVEPKEKAFKIFPYSSTKAEIIKQFKIYGWEVSQEAGNVYKFNFNNNSSVKLAYYEHELESLYFSFDKLGYLETQSLFFYETSDDVFATTLMIAAQEHFQLGTPKVDNPKPAIKRLTIPAKNNETFALLVINTLREHSLLSIIFTYETDTELN